MKNLELKLTQAWQNQSAALKLLSPLSALYGAVSQLRTNLYQQGVLKSYKAPVPILVIGNITVGGSGKTPLIIALIRYFQQKQLKIGVISRGYGGDAAQMPCLVQSFSTPSQVGDEPCLIAQSCPDVAMAVGADRRAAIELLLQHHPDLQLILSDDGLQHYALQRDFEWIVVDAMRGFGNEKLLPQGFLREPLSRLEGATVIYHDLAQATYPPQALHMHLQPAPLRPLIHTQAQPKPQPSTQPVYALTGIGHPQRFFDTLTRLGFVVHCQVFADHHPFTLTDLVPFSDYPIVVTEKDAVKLVQLSKTQPHAIFQNIWVLPVEAVLSDSVYRALDELTAQLSSAQAVESVR